MGVDIGKVCFWTKQGRQHGVEPTGRKVKMHRRRGHIRTYHRGLVYEFTGYIEPVWINAIAVPPPVVYTVSPGPTASRGRA